jgi:hypothetical protein
MPLITAKENYGLSEAVAEEKVLGTLRGGRD